MLFRSSKFILQFDCEFNWARVVAFFCCVELIRHIIIYMVSLQKVLFCDGMSFLALKDSLLDFSLVLYFVLVLIVFSLRYDLGS